MILPWWVKPAACIALALAFALGAKWFITATEQRGYDRAVAERHTLDSARLAAATLDARKQEKTLQDAIYQQAILRQQEKDRDDQTINALRAAAHAGAVRMRCPAARLPADTAPGNSTAASGLEPEAGSGDLVPEAAGDILDIAHRIKQGVRDRNALIDQYNAIRAACNAPATIP